ncbi:hypothetical protein DFH11DRAFT_1546137 [Phellopilus nigrolimitatus]|nr:hypothetical protein DFH11DRAFT_1546137 [Phellopilus nigrolimitatus]
MASSDISIDENTLCIIEGVLAQIRGSNDPVNAEKLWTLRGQVDITKLSFHDIDSLDSALNSTKQVFRQLEATKDALFLLARSCEQRLSALKVEMQPYFLHSGILSLPDDVLALIFENSLLDGKEYVRLYLKPPPEHSISHVCRRFRSISLGLPKLWSRVTSDMSKKWVETRLWRSKIAKLAVEIDGLQGGPACSSMAELQFVATLFLTFYYILSDIRAEVHRLMQEVFAGEPHLFGESEATNASRIRILRNPEPGPAKTSKLCPSSKPPSGVWDKEGLAMMLSDNIRRECEHREHAGGSAGPGSGAPESSQCARKYNGSVLPGPRATAPDEWEPRSMPNSKSIAMWLMTQRRHAAKRSANIAPVPKRAVWEPCLHTSAFPAPPANREPQATNTADSGK